MLDHGIILIKGLKDTTGHQPQLFSLAAAAKSLQLCPILCDPIDSSPVGSSVPGILQPRILEWVASSPNFTMVLNFFLITSKSVIHAALYSVAQSYLFETPWTVAHQARVHGISQARLLERVAISSSRGSSWLKDRTHVS